MATTVTTDEVRQLMDRGAQLVEVLPKDAYDREHLPGAISLPLTSMTPDGLGELDRTRPIVTYCYDLQCDLSPRAADWLTVLGFDDVYDYAASKVAWLALGLPVEGTTPRRERAGSRAGTPAPVGPGATVADLADAFDDWPVAVVTSGPFVVGVVRPEVLGLPPDTPVRSVLQPGPPSVRPSITVDELARSMDQDGQRWVLVTHLDGTYVGVVRRDDLDRDA
jgi:rhodanese-related sulfurtransferase